MQQRNGQTPIEPTLGNSTALASDNELSLPSLPGSPSLVHPELEDEFRNEDPQRAGWDSEAFHASADSQLKRLASLLRDDQADKKEIVGSLVSGGFAAAPLVPPRLAQVYNDSAVSVRRVAAAQPRTSELEGRTGFRTAIEQLASALDGAAEKQIKFKTIRVNLTVGGARTTSHFQYSGQVSASDANAAGIVQINATWHVGWTRDDPPRIQAIRVEDYEEVRPGPAGNLSLYDATQAVLSGNSAYRKQLAFGYDHWRARSDRSMIFDLVGNHGIAVGDIDGDHLDDVYVLQGGGLPNRLFRHNLDGTAQDVSAESAVDYLDFSRSALMVDVDNDGDQDLLLGLYWGWLALENDGTGRFQLKASHRCPGSVYSLAAADYDNDGDLDLYVCGRYADGSLSGETRVQGLPVPYHDANNGGPSSLWKNEGQWQFTDVTQQVGLNQNNRRFTLAAAWEDYDDDGDADLYVANDFGRNNLYRNDNGQFVDVAAETGVEDIGAGMSASWGDYDGDGRLDLYVGNMFSSAGNRITFQQQFMPGASEATIAQFQRHARGNSLFRNEGGGHFRDVTMPAGVNLGRWAWGSLFADINNDGREDIVVANGFITTEDTGDL